MRFLVIALLVLCVTLALCSRTEPITSLSFRPPLDESARFPDLDFGDLTLLLEALGHWNLGGDATITENGVRLTPAMPSRAGFMWARSVRSLMVDCWSLY